MSEQENILNRASQVFPQGNLGNVNYDLVISKGIGSRVWIKMDMNTWIICLVLGL